MDKEMLVDLIGNYNKRKEQSIDIIKNSSILDSEKMNELSKMQDSLQFSYIHKQIFRTKTEILLGVLNDKDFPTVDSKYWQTIREIDAMYNELINSSFSYKTLQNEIQEFEVSIEELKFKIENEDLNQFEIKKYNLKIEKYNIEIKKRIFELMNVKLQAEDRIRELKIWTDTLMDLRSQLKYNDSDPDEHQLNNYMAKFIRLLQDKLNEDIENIDINVVSGLLNILMRLQDLTIIKEILKRFLFVNKGKENYKIYSYIQGIYNAITATTTTTR